LYCYQFKFPGTYTLGKLDRKALIESVYRSNMLSIKWQIELRVCALVAHSKVHML